MGAEDQTLTRRPPPPWLRAEVAEIRDLAPWLREVTLAGAELRSMEPPGVAASVRLLVPAGAGERLEIPDWNGNEFLLGSGERPVIRTFTPMGHDRTAGTLRLAVVLHDGGEVSRWVGTAERGGEVAVSGPGRGWEPPGDLGAMVVLGDESAVPAIGQVLSSVAADVRCEAHLELRSDPPEEILGRSGHASVSVVTPDASSAPGSGLVRAAERITEVPADTHVWAAGEAASMQAIRKHLHRALGTPRDRTTIRGYWKQGR